MYFLSDIKKILTNKVIIIVSAVLLLMMVLDPISIYWTAGQYPDFFQSIGSNPFQFWLLMNSAGWGFAVFNVIFWSLPMLIVACIYFYERKSSVATYLMIRKSKTSYYISKVISVFTVTFLLFAILLLLNVLITYSIFPNQNSFSEQYKFYIPSEGTFAHQVYSISPFLMAVAYCLINAFVLAIIGVFYLAVQILLNFKNQYIAILLPIIIVYGLIFLFDSFTPLYHFNLSLFIQPMAASSLNEPITLNNILFTFGIWIFVDIMILIVGMIKNRDVL